MSRNPADCAELVEATVRELGRLDVLINMASIYEAVPFNEMTERDWQRNLDINLRSVFLCTKAAVPHLRRQGGGRVINFADWLADSGRPGYAGYVAYYTAKAGVIALTEALALELAADGILVNAIAPGPIVPPPDLSEEERTAVAAATPLAGGAVRWRSPRPCGCSSRRTSSPERPSASMAAAICAREARRETGSREEIPAGTPVGRLPELLPRETPHILIPRVRRSGFRLPHHRPAGRARRAPER